MIYLVEDDESIRELVTYTFDSLGVKTKGFSLPQEFWRAIEKEIPELIMLDIMLPQEDGLEILKKLRENGETAKIPIIMLTAKGSEYDKVLGLNLGADDYVSKPFGMMELVARVKALLRRTEKSETQEYFAGSLYLSKDKHIVKADGEEITLTYKEFEILYTLMKNRGTVFSRDKLLEIVWGYTYEGESRTVDVHIRTLRQKLGSAGDIIETIRGVGYKIGGK